MSALCRNRCPEWSGISVRYRQEYALAYQVVNYIRLKLAVHGIKYSWTTIVEKMQAQQCSLQSVNKKEGVIYTKLCTRPNEDMKAIYEALGYKDRPFVRKSKVVTQLQN